MTFGDSNCPGGNSVTALEILVEHACLTHDRSIHYASEDLFVHHNGVTR